MIRVLCVDIEGGFGGSSRSLYQSIRHLDRSQVDIKVICRLDGPVVSKYRDIGIDVQVMPLMHKASSLPRLSRNLYVYGLAGVDWIRSWSFRQTFLENTKNVDIVHFNHESLWLLSAWLRKRCNKSFVMHLRTNPWGSWFARQQANCIAQTIDQLVFITENERKTWTNLAGKPLVGRTIYNIVGHENIKNIQGIPSINIKRDPRYTIACVSNYSYLRGVDQVIELAAEIKTQGGMNDVRFVFCGNISMTRSEAKMLGIPHSADAKLTTYADLLNVSEMCVFLGHVSAPENVLAKVDALIKPTREANPWGRDILEGLAAGLPVFTTGTYNRFVEDGVTGVLQPQFDKVKLAQRILQLAKDRESSQALGMAGQTRVQELCNGPERARDLLELWQRVSILGKENQF